VERDRKCATVGGGSGVVKRFAGTRDKETSGGGKPDEL